MFIFLNLNTVKPLLSGHLRDLPKCPLKRGCLPNRSNRAVYKSGTGTMGQGRVCEDLGLGDARRGTWGRQV